MKSSAEVMKECGISRATLNNLRNGYKAENGKYSYAPWLRIGVHYAWHRGKIFYREAGIERIKNRPTYNNRRSKRRALHKLEGIAP